MSRNRGALLALLSATAATGTVACDPARVFAVTTSWRLGAPNDQWSDPANWTNGVPGPNDDAFLTAAFMPIDLGAQTRAVRRLNAVAVPLTNGRIDARLLNGADANFVALSSSGALEVRGAIGATLGDGAGGGDFDVFGSSLGGSPIVLRGINTYVGTTELLWSATLDGALTGTSRISVPFSTLNVSVNAAADNQLSDSAVLRLERGTVAFASSVARVESFGPLELGPRESLVRMTGPGAGSYVASASSLNWSPGGMLRIDLGANARLVVRDAPLPLPSGNLTDRPILPWAYALTPTQPSFLTYDHGPDVSDPADDGGLRPLDLATEYTSDVAAGGNVRLTSDRTIGSNVMARSLTLVNAAIALDGRLTLSGNGLLLVNTAPLDQTRITGTGALTFPGDAVIHASTDFVDRYEIGVPIEAPSLTKGGGGELLLTQVNNIPGGIYVAEGVVHSRAQGALGSGTVGLGGQLFIENVSQSVQHLRVFSGVSRPGTSISDSGTLHVTEGLVLIVSQSVTGEGALRQSGPGTVHVTGSGAGLRLNWMVGSPDATLRVDGSIGGAGSLDLQVNSVGLLSGAGTIGGSVNVNAGRLAPGPGPARLTIDRLNVGVFAVEEPVIEVELNGLQPGVGYDQLTILSTVQLSSARAGLSVLPGFDAQAGDTFTIIDKLSDGSVVGRFTSLPEGAVFLAGAELFQITYAGGDGNDIVLTVVPEPAAMTVVAFGFAGIVRRHRRIRWG